MQYSLTSEKLSELNMLLQELENEETRLALEARKLIKENEEVRETFEYEHLIFRLRYEIPRRKREIIEKISILKNLNKLDYDNKSEIVDVGTKVTLDYGDEQQTFIISPVNENDLNKGIIARNAPIVECILGKKKGDAIQFNDFTVKIVNIEKI